MQNNADKAAEKQNLWNILSYNASCTRSPVKLSSLLQLCVSVLKLTGLKSQQLCASYAGHSPCRTGEAAVISKTAVQVSSACEDWVIFLGMPAGRWRRLAERKPYHRGKISCQAWLSTVKSQTDEVSSATKTATSLLQCQAVKTWTEGHEAACGQDVDFQLCCCSWTTSLCHLLTCGPDMRSLSFSSCWKGETTWSSSLLKPW